MNKQHNTKKGLLAKYSRGTRHYGFTLIELLATLTIMAVIAAILFPFVSNYTKKANINTQVRSLRLLQDAMDRYRSTAEDSLSWALGGGASTTVNGVTYTYLSDSNAVSTILSDILTDAANKTMTMPVDGLTNENVKIVTTGTNTLEGSWEVAWFRKKTNADGVNRRSEEITTNAWGTFGATEIGKAFTNTSN